MPVACAIEFDAEMGDDAAMRSAYLPRLFVAVFGACASVPVIAAESYAGRDIAANCASCHHGDRSTGAAERINAAGLDYRFAYGLQELGLDGQ